MRARGRGAGAYIIAALVMLACALLPLLFMPRSQAPLPYGEAEQLGTTRSQRAELFTRYFTDGELERRGFEPTMDEREGVIACRALANSVLTGLCADSTLPEPALRRVLPRVDGGLEQLVFHPHRPGHAGGLPRVYQRAVPEER